MKQKTNGKIVIAILAMFAVAISIIGFTYAYFTATFNQNLLDKSVTVNAGELVANFIGTNTVDVKNVVPGWKSDGLTYYDATVAQSHNGQIFATTLSNPADYYSANEMTKREYESNGLTAPVQFTVENDSDSPDAVSYIIRLTNIVNGIYDATTTTSDETLRNNLTADLANLRVHLYSGQYNYSQPNYGGTLISSFQLDNGVNENDVQILTSKSSSSALNTPHTIAKDGEPQHFFVIFEYLNVEDVVDGEGNVTSSGLQLAQNVTLSAKVDIIGVQESNETKATPLDDARWYDSNNREVILPVYTPGS